MQYFKTSIMICCRATALILDIATMKKIKQISINSEVQSENFSQLYHPLISPHMIPETQNTFMLELHEAQYVYVRNVSTGARQELIQGSPNCPKGTPCAFFLK